ncbi:hypothetical protein C7212DRAFT_286356 [Tuber magnatum]|uniref:Exosome complex protein n=1 Tax=Tuber magnatum TaxID=42249 RepID=A0A317SEV6_9PEZI|nr:hypothetical protein C7212DRAFT_286356 [Tuber magnatum]
MDSSTAVELLDLLDEQIDDLKPAVEPLLKDTISKTAIQLPVVDKAKLYVLTSYVLESLLFSYLKLSNTELKSHAIMSELARVRTYMTKIKEAQPNMHRREMTINKEAVERIVNAGLVGNDKRDAENAEMKAKERAAALAKFNALSEKIERETATLSKKQRQKQRKARRNQEAAAAQRELDYDESGEVITIDGGDEVAVEGAGKGEGEAKADEKLEVGVEGAEAEAEDKEVVEEKRAGSSKRTKQSKNRTKKRRKIATGRE